MTKVIRNGGFRQAHRTIHRGLLGLLLAAIALALFFPTGCASTAERIERREDRRDDRRDRIDQRMDQGRDLREDRRDDRADRLGLTR